MRKIMNEDVLQISPDDLRRMVEEMVEIKLATIFHDPEDGLELTDELKKILARQDERIKNGDRGVPFEEVVAELGLN